MNSAILFLTYKRLDTTRLVFNAICQAKPKKIYFASNAAKDSGEIINVNKIRDFINEINWPCEIHTLFRENHLSVKYSISSAIDWFFENESEGIILEDDCLPDPTFFQYCDELLEKYRDDKRISQISGVNLQGNSKTNSSYYFSRNIHIWGWATWASRWKNSYDVEMSSWKEFKQFNSIENIINNKSHKKYWSNIFDEIANDKMQTWDYQWVYANWINYRLSIMPNKDLITNIGFGPEATFTKESSPLSNLPVYPMTFPMNHPKYIYPESMLEEEFYNKFNKTNYFRRIKTKILRIMGI